MTPEQKKRRFRELAKHDRMQTGRPLAEEHEQPFLPLINDCPDMQRRKSARPATNVRPSIMLADMQSEHPITP
jgi:hypothetical protein